MLLLTIWRMSLYGYDNFSCSSTEYFGPMFRSREDHPIHEKRGRRSSLLGNPRESGMNVHITDQVLSPPTLPLALPLRSLLPTAQTIFPVGQPKPVVHRVSLPCSHLHSTSSPSRLTLIAARFARWTRCENDLTLQAET